jgi:hypothetical protein
MTGYWRTTEGKDGTPQPEWFTADEAGTQSVVQDSQKRALATLLAVLEVATVQDAANAVGLTPDDLIAEAQAWEAAETNA